MIKVDVQNTTQKYSLLLKEAEGVTTPSGGRALGSRVPRPFSGSPLPLEKESEVTKNIEALFLKEPDELFKELYALAETECSIDEATLLETELADASSVEEVAYALAVFILEISEKQVLLDKTWIVMKSLVGLEKAKELLEEAKKLEAEMAVSKREVALRNAMARGEKEGFEKSMEHVMGRVADLVKPPSAKISKLDRVLSTARRSFLVAEDELARESETGIALYEGKKE